MFDNLSLYPFAVKFGFVMNKTSVSSRILNEVVMHVVVKVDVKFG